MSAHDRTSRPLPTTLATLAALLAMVAAASVLPHSPGFERSRVWTLRPLEGQDQDLRVAVQFTSRLARAARDLLGAPPPCTAAVTSLHHAPLITTQSARAAPVADAPRPRPPQVIVSHMALPPPLA